MTKLIIKGAIYTDGGTLLRPHFTGDFHTVDCTEFKTKEEIKSNYSKENAKQFLSGYYLTYEGVKYFECEYSPYHTEGMELLSDLSELEFFDENTDF
jgi:hypothetical protein